MSNSPLSLTEFLDPDNNLASALHRAFASGARNILIPPGRHFVTETIRIPSGTELTAHPEAHIVLADGAARTSQDYLLTNADRENGAKDITIEGGLWDGNNLGNPRPTGLFDEGYTGAMFHFENVTGLTLRNLTLTNAEAYYTRYTHVHDFHIEDIRFDSENVRNNNDGVHLGGNCSRGVIRNIRGLRPGVTGDDMVPLNADDALQRTEVRGMTNGPIEDIVIENIQAEDCHSFVRLLSVWSPIRNVRIANISGTCSVSAINADAARGCRVPIFDEKNPPFPDGVGLLENIETSFLRVAKSQANGIALLRLETQMKNFTVRDFVRMTDLDQDPKAPSLAVNHASPRGLHVI